MMIIVSGANAVRLLVYAHQFFGTCPCRLTARHGADVNVTHNPESNERKLHTRYFLSLVEQPLENSA